MSDDLISLLTDLLESPRFDSFSKWEKDFLASVDDQIDSGSLLSEKQIEKVEELWEKYFD